ncbi:DNA processing protein DprA [Pasteurellaceae bacterium Macca]|nr:DNA processing protein DprA [Pasteurellaceae bacterium Macca]
MAMIEGLLRLTQVPQLGAQRIAKLLEKIDLGELLHYDSNQLRQMGWNEKQIQRWQHPKGDWIAQALRWAEQPDCHILSLFDDDYPFLLKQISTAPPLLFVQGSVASLSLPQIAMVGSRDFSAYGKHWASYLAEALVSHQLAVTSGLAIGIDGFCHEQVVQSGGVTIAVLGSGLAQIYPTRHKRLATQIIERGGALVSEFLPQQPPIAENFPRRNRIISGLSLGTLVIEATINSGSLITARYALEQGREVFALPNGIHHPQSAGCHKLIKQGALLVDSIEDILDAIAFQHQPRIHTPQPTTQPMLFETSNRPIQAVQKKAHFAPSIQNLTACQQQIMAEIGLNPITIDDLAKATDLNVEALLVELLTLELLALVKSVSGGYVLGEG